MERVLTLRQLIDGTIKYFAQLYEDVYMENINDVHVRISRGHCYVLAYYLHLVAKAQGMTTVIYTSYYHVWIMSEGKIFDSLNIDGTWPDQVDLPEVWKRLFSFTAKDVYRGRPFMDEVEMKWYFYNRPELVLLLDFLLSKHGLTAPDHLKELLVKGKGKKLFRRMTTFINSLN